MERKLHSFWTYFQFRTIACGMVWYLPKFKIMFHAQLLYYVFVGTFCIKIVTEYEIYLLKYLIVLLRIGSKEFKGDR